MTETASGQVGVVGLGYVGLPLSLAMTEAGYEVVGVDVDTNRIESLREGQSYVNDVDNGTVSAALANGFEPTTSYADLSTVDAVSICVPTPMRKSGTPNLSYVASAVEDLADVISEDVTVVLESTVYPGATEKFVAETLSENGLVVGENVFVAFSPERIDPGNESYGPTDIPKVLGGVTTACGDRAEAIYSPIFDEIVRVDSATEAELVKLLENTFRAVNIGLINELAQIAHQLDVNIWNAIDAAATKPFGYMPFYPGPGLGGHCIPVDPMFLSWQANQQGIETRFIDLADRINREMPEHVVRRVVKQLNDRGLALSNADVLVLGVAYKPDVSDTRESPAVDIIDYLTDWQATVQYHDPYVPILNVLEESYESVELTPDRLADADCVLLITDHSSFDIDAIVEHAPLVFDTRNATSKHYSDDIVRL
jgi:UDP-N-acetyl-D-glucosamine dehydrogenase